MKMNIKNIICAILVSFFIVSSATGIEVKQSYLSDFDPLTDVEVTVEIQKIRALYNYDPQVQVKEYIDLTSDPDFYVKIIINDQEFTSNIWHDTKYIYEPQFSATLDVPDDKEFVAVKIQLWDWNYTGDVLCDVGDEENDVELSYSIKTGQWTGDDQLEDISGYGRLNGCDDGSIYEHQRDCELWFNIYQNDFDNDGIPYWIETNVYGTDPEFDNTGEDEDSDECPIEWEYKWEYDPYLWDDHENLDPDVDSLNNIEEYFTRKLGSDPFRKDLFLEIDYMEEGPNGEQSIVPEDTGELLKNPFHRRNIVFHLDVGYENGGEIIPFDNETDQTEVKEIYNKYFLHDDKDNWRRSVFHYGVFVYLCKPNGYAFSGDGSQFWGYGPGTNSFVIASKNMERLSEKTLKPLNYIYASSIMHETGHNFGIRWGHPFGCDARFSYKPWQIGFWLYFNYKSIMNYIYTYSILDYSDGSHGRRDYDDWANIDLTYFEIPNDSNPVILNSSNDCCQTQLELQARAQNKIELK